MGGIRHLIVWQTFTDLLCEIIELIKILLGRIRAISAGATSALVAERVFVPRVSFCRWQTPLYTLLKLKSEEIHGQRDGVLC